MIAVSVEHEGNQKQVRIAASRKPLWLLLREQAKVREKADILLRWSEFGYEMCVTVTRAEEAVRRPAWHDDLSPGPTIWFLPFSSSLNLPDFTVKHSSASG
jgi:hypothetical protein